MSHPSSVGRNLARNLRGDRSLSECLVLISAMLFVFPGLRSVE